MVLNLNSSSLVTHQVLCFMFVWLAYASTYLLRKPLGVVKTDLGTDLGASKSGLGWCDTALILPYATIQICFPSLADRFGARRVLSMCLCMASLATLATYSATNLFTFSIGLPSLEDSWLLVGLPAPNYSEFGSKTQDSIQFLV